MVTSRGTGRWVLPKGWEMDGKKSWEAAEIEALEEAGITGEISRKEIGSYHYWKCQGQLGHWSRVLVYPMVVTRLKRNWKERDERKRRWFPVLDAAGRVHEPELANILLRLHHERIKNNLPKALLRALHD